MNPNFRNNNFSDKAQGRNVHQVNESQQQQQQIFSSPVNQLQQFGNGNIQNEQQMNQIQFSQQLPASRISHQSNQSVQQNNQKYILICCCFSYFQNRIIGSTDVLTDKGLLDPKALNQMTPRSKVNVEQQYRQEQQNYFMQQMHSINDFYNQLNSQNNGYDPQDYQQNPPRKGINYQQFNNNYPIINQQNQSGMKQPMQGEQNYYLNQLTMQSPSSTKNQQMNNPYNQYQQFLGVNYVNQIMEQSQQLNDNYNQFPTANMSKMQGFYGNQYQLQEGDQHMRIGSPLQQNTIYNQNFQNRGQQGINITDRKERQDDYNGSRQNTNGNNNQQNEIDQNDKNQYKQQQQQLYQQQLLLQMQQQQQQKQKRLLDYDEIFNLSSNQTDSMLNTQNLETAYDKMQINTKYHMENLKATQNMGTNQPNQSSQIQTQNSIESQNNLNQQRRPSIKEFDDVPITSQGATKNFEELLEEEMKKNNIAYEKKQETEKEKQQKKRGDTPQFREGSGTASKRNKTESPQRFLKQGEGKGGRTTSVVPKHQNKKNLNKIKKQDSMDESIQFQRFEEILNDISSKKSDFSTDDILKIQKQEQDIIEVRGDKIRLDNIEIDEKLEKVLVTKYVNDKINDLNFYIKQFQDAYQKARVFKQTYEENIKKFDIMKQNYEEKMLKEKSEFEEQKKHIEAEYRLLKKLQQEKVTSSAVQPKSKDTSVEREDENTMKSLLRYKEEVKSLRDKLGRLQFDSKKKIEDMQLSLNNTIKENRKLRKEVNGQKKVIDQCEDLKYIVNPNNSIKEDPREDQDKSSNERDYSSERQAEIPEAKKPVSLKGIPRNEKDAKINREAYGYSNRLNKSQELRQKSEDSQTQQKNDNKNENEQQIKTQNGPNKSTIGSKKNVSISENLKEQTNKLKSLVQSKVKSQGTPKFGEEQQSSEHQMSNSMNESTESKKKIPRQNPSTGNKNPLKSSTTNQQSQQITQSEKNNLKQVQKPIKKVPLSRYQSLKKFTIEEIGVNIEQQEFKYNGNKFYQQYQEIVDKKPQQTETNKDGSITNKYEKGVKEIIHKNKTKQISFPSGYQIVFFPTGDIKQVFPNDIEQYYFSSNKATQTTLLEGQSVILFSNNQIELTYPDGTKQIKFPEGMTKTVDLNGEETVKFPNGVEETLDQKKVKTIKYQDGTSKTVYPDNFMVNEEFSNNK